jgi:hypothetical protein
MRIDDQVRCCTSFLSIRKNVQDGYAFHPVGTVFFVGEVLGRGRAIKYAVTARHVVDLSRPFGSLWVRCISADGKKKLFEFPPDSWWSHPTTDVAIAPLLIPLEDYGLRFLPLELFADAAWLQEHDVGIGDHVVASGLFSQYIGQKRDAPIVRFGRIALVPDEPLRIPARGPLPSMEFSVILAELGSWGGQSGSPVFVYFSVDRDLFAGEALRSKIPNPRLLGLLHGHYNFPQGVVSLSETANDAHVLLNSGIAIVVPATSVLELLAQDQAAAHRAKFTRILREDGLID